MSIKPTSVPSKFLSQAISSTASSFKVNNIEGWGINSLGANIDLTSADFGTQAYCVFRNATGTVIEIMEFDPTTIASASITIIARGLPFDGTTTPVSTYKLDWPAGTVIQFGTDVPQLINSLATGGAAALALKANLASPAFTGNPTAPTQTSTDSSTKLASTAFVQANKIGYVLGAAFGSVNPLDSTTYYWGFAQGTAPNTTADGYRMYITKAGTIKLIDIFINVQGTLASNEASTISVRLNNSSDTLISNTFVLTAVSNHASTVVSIAVAVGDYFEIKWLTPAYATNPTTVRGNAIIYVE